MQDCTCSSGRPFPPHSHILRDSDTLRCTELATGRDYTFSLENQNACEVPPPYMYNSSSHSKTSQKHSLSLVSTFSPSRAPSKNQNQNE